MDLGLEGKRALVAAASRGLGRAVAEELAREGCKLLICSRGAEALERTREEISELSGEKVSAVAVDLSKEADVERLLRTSEEELGGVDILVTNVGGPPAGRFEDHSAETWRMAISQNLESVLNLTRGVLPGMRKQAWGRILNITSISVKQPVDQLILSNSLRAAVTGFARTLANEVAAQGITVNNLLPGYTLTQRVQELAESAASSRDCSPEEVFAGWEEQIPMGRLGRPEEFAALAAFLASDRASYITGASIPVDGGWIRALY